MNRIQEHIFKIWKTNAAHPSTKEVELGSTDEDSASEIDSEESYGGGTHFDSDRFETFIFFYTNPTFMFIATLANVTLFAHQTYMQTFYIEETLKLSMWTIGIECFCYILVFIEIISSLCHRFCTKTALRRPTKPRNIYIIMIDLIVQFLCIFFTFAYRLQKRLILTFFLEMVKLFRVLAYYRVISLTPGKRTLFHTISKFGLIFFVVTHIASTIFAITNVINENTNISTLKKRMIGLLGTAVPVPPIDHYVFCLFSAWTAISGVGVIARSPENDAEALLMVALMIFGLGFFNGVTLGTCTSTRIDIYRAKAVFYNRLKLINKNLNDTQVPAHIKFKINNYYKEFWMKEHGKLKSRLFNQLPESIRKCALLDKYWNAFSYSNLFPNTHTGFKRSLSLVMHTMILTTGEILYAQHADKDTLMYIASGTIQLLSALDMESPLVTLGVGTFIGEINLIATTKSPLQIVASSYCVIHCLKKIDLFRVCARYKKLGQSQILHEQYRKILEFAKENIKKSMSSNVLSFEMRIKKQVYNRKDIKSLYVVTEEFVKKDRQDEIFYRTKFPWVLKANSTLIFYWDVIIVVVVLFVSIWMPLHFAFREDSQLFFVSYHYIQLLYTFDVLIQIIIVAEDENGEHSKISKILLVRLMSFKFIVDIIAAMPMYLILSVIKMDITSGNKYLKAFSSFLKLYKVVLMFSRVENTFKFNMAALRLLKYCLFFLYMAFLFTTIHYMLAFDEQNVYYKQSWIGSLKLVHPDATPMDTFLYSFQVNLILIFQCGSALLMTNQVELLCANCFVISGVLICTFIAADYAATLTLQNYSRAQYSENVMVINKLSQSEQMKSTDNMKNLNRISNYLLWQWRFTGGQTLKNLLEDMPKHLYNSQQTAKYSETFRKIHAFRDLGEKFHNALAEKAELVHFSPNEIFIHANEPSTDMYILQKGYSELISSKNKRLNKIIGPGDAISVVECLLGLNDIYFVRPITSVALLRVSQIDLMEAFRKHTTLENFIRKYRLEMKNSVIAKKIFDNQDVKIYISDYVKETTSLFKFPADKTDPLYQDLIRGWGNMIILKYIMLPWTILPEGRFSIIWEVIYNMCMFFLIMLTLTTDIYLSVSPRMQNIVYTLEIVQIIGMYIRFHVCYYDENGILITHPRSTAKHYLTGAFIVDLIALFPMSTIYMAFNSNTNEPLYYAAIFNLNKLLLLYRLHLIFYHFTKDDLKPHGIILTVLKFLPMSIIYMNVCAAILLAIAIKVTHNGDEIKISTTARTIIDYVINTKYLNFDTYVPAHVYLLTMHWVTTTTMLYGFPGVAPARSIDVIVYTAVVVSGFILFTYILVTISNSQTTLNSQLTTHQSHMKDVVNFMKEERVQKALQIKAIEYFEYGWQRHHGFTITNVANECHRVLYEDFLHDQYTKVFRTVRIFVDDKTTVFRRLSLNLNRECYLSDVAFIKLNDVVSRLYIVYSGDVKVYNANNDWCATLSTGSVFGNIDNVAHTRSMLTYVSSGSIDLLEIKTTVFYSIISSGVASKLQRHILLKNLSFIKGIFKSTASSKLKKDKFVQLSKKELKKLKILNSMGLNMLFALCSYFSIGVSLYTITFDENHYMPPVYAFDFIHVLIIVVKFYTPFYDAKGQFITSKKLIKKRLVKRPWFYINLFATIPGELIILIPIFAHYESALNITCRLLIINRCLRFFNIVDFFRQFSDLLKSNLLVMKVASIFIYITLLLHLQTCLLYVFSTSGTYILSKDSWAYTDGEYPLCGNRYLCTFYVCTSILTMSGCYVELKSRYTVLIVTVFIICDKMLMAMFIAQVSASIQNYRSNIIQFDTKYTDLQNYMKRSVISKPLIKDIVEYTSQLWSQSQGVQEPILLSNAPLYLQEHIKSDIYGKHIYDNLIFANCHKDFVRHLVKYLKVETYFTNNTICEQGDINETVYFIHKGSVDVFFITDTEEIKVDELEELDCFGIIQGLYPRTPHTHTFRATTVTIVLTLKLSDWFYILHFYPASKFYIYNKLASICSTNY